MAFYGNVNAKVAENKRKHPERYCPVPRCLWKTARLDHATQTFTGGGFCPRHGGKASPAERA
jgi:hypothetical protein